MSTSRRTSALSLTVLGGAGLVGGRLLRNVLDSLGTNPPRVGWSAALTLVFIAVILGGFAWSTWQSLHKRGERMTSDHAIRMLALAKASALVGALVAGGYFGYALAFAEAFDTPLGKERVIRAAAAGVGGLLIMIAGLLLERALQLPGGGDDETEGGPAQTDATPA